MIFFIYILLLVIQAKHFSLGSFAEVHKVQNSIDKQYYAAKIYTKFSQTPKTSKNIKKEIQLLKLLKGKQNFLQIYEVFEEEDCIVLITELIEGGDLYNKIKEIKIFSEQQAQTIFKQLATGLQELQELKIVHRDLKLENILFKNKVTNMEDSNTDNLIIKIADFGLSDIINDDKKVLYTKCGTPGYIAPEIFCSQGYTEKVDIFSAGIILYTLINGTPPYKGKNLKDIVKKTKTEKIHFKKQV